MMWFILGILESAACLVLALFWLMWPDDRAWMLQDIGAVPCPFDL